MTTLREAATAAYDERQQDALDRLAEERRALEARVRRQFKDDFDADPEIVTVNDVRSGDLVLRCQFADESPGARWRLRGRCSECDRDLWSEPFFDLPGLGRQLAAFEADWPHDCTVGKVGEEKEDRSVLRSMIKPTPTELILLQALREWSDARMGGG